MGKFLLCAALLAAALPLADRADPPSYTYVEGGYSKATTSGFSGGSGYGFDGSYAFASNWFVAASYRHNSFNGGALTGGFFTRDELLTIGGHLALTDSMDLVGRIGYANDKWNQGPSTSLFPGFVVATSDTRDGYDFGAGIRTLPTDNWEFDAFLDYDNAGLLSHDHTTTEVVGSAALRYNYSQRLSFGLSYARGSRHSASNWMLNGRWYFFPTP
ncbi:MAG: outer membrane beta-barrel protein [Gammaproteobacteria bacterium]